MNPEQFLWEEVRNVKAALKETLRYDYGPDPVHDYYVECDRRLAQLEREIPNVAPEDLWEQFEQLSSLTFWISLIERSRLGEFSWPFAEKIREIARPLLAERDLGGAVVNPIVHVIGEGSGYQIDYEATVSPAVSQRFAIVAFPRSLKHHVLLHVIFGHELGHAAQNTALVAPLLDAEVKQPLSSDGKLVSNTDIMDWLRDPLAPASVRTQLQELGADYEFTDDDLENWLQELICDLFGLLLFGPAFIAAHRVMIRSGDRDPYEFGPTHPPYAVRQRMLVQSMRLLGWDQPSTDVGLEPFRSAEERALQYVLDDGYSAWATLVTDEQLRDALDGVRRCLVDRGGFQYDRPRSAALCSLLQKLQARCPPIMSEIDANGVPSLQQTPVGHILYAGWVTWLGLADQATRPDAFLEINKLCNQALLQECAIQRAAIAGT